MIMEPLSDMNEPHRTTLTEPADSNGAPDTEAKKPRSAPAQIAEGQKDSSTASLYIRDLTVAYHRKPVLWDVDFEAPQGLLIGIIGPNGAGKSTLLKAVLDLIPRASGQIMVFGKPYRQQRRLVAYVPQRETVDWDFPVNSLDVVAMGLYSQIGWCRPVTRKYRRAALEALDRVGMADYARRQISQLSGGQQQRVFLARALVQDARLYLMDEPFAGVDAATEKAIIVLLGDLRSSGKTVLAVHHDLQTVPEYFDHIMLLNMRVVAYGPTEKVFTTDNLQKTYGGRLTLLDQAVHAISGRGQSG